MMSQSQSFSQNPNSRSGRLEDSLDFLEEVGFEGTLAHRVPAKVASALSMWRVQILKIAEHHPASERFNRAVLEALDNGVIDCEEYRRLLGTTLILQGAVGVSDDNVALCAIEASYTAHGDGIDKALESASILRRVFVDTEVHSALYCIELQEGIEEAAERRGVALLQGESPR